MTMHNTLLIVEGSEIPQPLNLDDIKEILLPYKFMHWSNPPAYINELWDEMFWLPVLSKPMSSDLVWISRVKDFSMMDLTMQRKRVYNHVDNYWSEVGKPAYQNVIFYDFDTKVFEESLLTMYLQGSLIIIQAPSKIKYHMKITEAFLDRGDSNYCYSLKMRI